MRPRIKHSRTEDLVQRIRQEEYERCLKVLTRDHSQCPLPMSCVGYQNAVSDLEQNPPNMNHTELDKEFDERFRDKPVEANPDLLLDIFKAFLHEKLAAQEAEHNDCCTELTRLADEMFLKGKESGASAQRTAFRERVEGMRKKQLTAEEALLSSHPYPNDAIFIHNAALDQVLKAIDEV